jgi:hypothetical protein
MRTLDWTDKSAATRSIRPSARPTNHSLGSGAPAIAWTAGGDRVFASVLPQKLQFGVVVAVLFFENRFHPHTLMIL